MGTPQAKKPEKLNIRVKFMNVVLKTRFLTCHTLQFIKIDILPVFVLLIPIE